MRFIGEIIQGMFVVLFAVVIAIWLTQKGCGL